MESIQSPESLASDEMQESSESIIETGDIAGSATVRKVFKPQFLKRYRWGKCEQHPNRALQPYYIRLGLLSGRIVLMCSGIHVKDETGYHPICRNFKHLPMSRFRELPEDLRSLYRSLPACVLRSRMWPELQGTRTLQELQESQ